jgi:predicted nucleotidyltransferase
MIHGNILSIIEELVLVFKKITLGEYAIALAGSYAKGKWDLNSDIDIFVFCDKVKPFCKRKALIEQICDNSEIYIDEEIDKTSWGGCMDFYYKGFKIEATIRTITSVTKTINECKEGIIRIEPTVWNLNGYYNYIYLSECSFIKSLDDPYGIIKHWKKEIEIYPLKLKKAIINEFLWKAKFWMDNFHYKSAIKRKDIIYTSGIIQQTIHNIVQLLFAINEKFFEGDKKIEEQIVTLKFKPTGFVENIEFLLSSPKKQEILAEQRKMLLDVIEDIEQLLV